MGCSRPVRFLKPDRSATTSVICCAVPKVDGQTMPALEMLAAQYFLGAPLIEKTDAPYRVNFGGIDSLPQIKLERIIAGDLVSELVQERSVIVGFAREILGLHTPLTAVASSLW